MHRYIKKIIVLSLSIVVIIVGYFFINPPVQSYFNTSVGDLSWDTSLKFDVVYDKRDDLGQLYIISPLNGNEELLLNNTSTAGLGNFELLNVENKQLQRFISEKISVDYEGLYIMSNNIADGPHYLFRRSPHLLWIFYPECEDDAQIQPAPDNDHLFIQFSFKCGSRKFASPISVLEISSGNFTPLIEGQFIGIKKHN